MSYCFHTTLTKYIALYLTLFSLFSTHVFASVFAVRGIVFVGEEPAAGAKVHITMQTTPPTQSQSKVRKTFITGIYAATFEFSGTQTTANYIVPNIDPYPFNGSIYKPDPDNIPRRGTTNSVAEVDTIFLVRATSTVKGSVVNASTGMPLQGATVSVFTERGLLAAVDDFVSTGAFLQDPFAFPYDSATTDAQGNYTLLLPPGDFLLMATSEDLVPSFENINLSDDTELTVNFSLRTEQEEKRKKDNRFLLQRYTHRK